MPKPQAKIGTMLDLLQKNPEATQADLAELEAATQPRRPPVIRASTLSERLRDKYYDLFQSAARQPIGRLADALGLSDLQGIANERATGGKLVMASAVPPPGESKIATKAVQTAKGFTVWHGSPHDFPPVRHIRMPDGTELFQNMSELAKTPKGATVLEEFPLGRFDLSKIGTGEGAQAYGHGLYFADKQGTAAAYKQAGVHDPRDAMSLVMNELKAHPGNDLELAETARRALSQRKELAALAQDDDAIRHVVTVVRGQEPGGTVSNAAIQSYRALDNRMDALPKGRMYEVNIHADPEDFLDWDKPLSQQSEKVQQQVQKASGFRVSTPEEIAQSEAQAADLFRQFKAAGVPGKTYSRGERLPPEQDALFRQYFTARAHADELKNNLNTRGEHVARGNERALNEAGIPGIKYLDQNSRAVGEGTRNWVVWDTSVVKILGKLGIAAAVINDLQKQAIANGGKVRADDVHALIQSGGN